MYSVFRTIWIAEMRNATISIHWHLNKASSGVSKLRPHQTTEPQFERILPSEAFFLFLGFKIKNNSFFAQNSTGPICLFVTNKHRFIHWVHIRVTSQLDSGLDRVHLHYIKAVSLTSTGNTTRNFSVTTHLGMDCPSDRVVSQDVWKLSPHS